jgi:hypothetical protein
MRVIANRLRQVHSNSHHNIRAAVNASINYGFYTERFFQDQINQNFFRRTNTSAIVKPGCLVW